MFSFPDSVALPRQIPKLDISCVDFIFIPTDRLVSCMVVSMPFRTVYPRHMHELLHGKVNNDWSFAQLLYSAIMAIAGSD